MHAQDTRRMYEYDSMSLLLDGGPKYNQKGFFLMVSNAPASPVLHRMESIIERGKLKHK